MQSLFIETLNTLPKNDFILQEYVGIIFFAIPLSKKEVADEVIKGIKTKFGHVDIRFEKTTDPSRTEIGVRNGVIDVKTGNEELTEKITWFKENLSINT